MSELWPVGWAVTKIGTHRMDAASQSSYRVCSPLERLLYTAEEARAVARFLEKAADRIDELDEQDKEGGR